MGKIIMEEANIITEYESKVDASRRITLRKGKNHPVYEHYRTIHLEDGTIIHKPLVLVSPDEVISSESLAILDQSVTNANKGKVGGTFKAKQYKDLLDKDEDDD